jgi:thiol-disulfide isomerase/thioredoxin
MKRREALALAAAPLLVPSAPASAAPAQPGQPVDWPDVTLLDGSRLSAAQLQSQPAVVVFWTTSCPFCRRHNQHVEKLHRAVLASGSPLRVLGAAKERDVALVRRYAQQQGYSFPITLDHAALAASLSERKVIPLTAVVDAQGRLKQVLPGEMFEEDLMELLVLAQKGTRS